MAGPRHILVEARPGSGKTTLARSVVGRLLAAGVAVAGFTTEEIRHKGRRLGFAVEAVGGDRSILAHVDRAGPPRVGKYGVDLAAFEAVALPALEASGVAVVVVDEIGKMELASESFRDAAMRCFDGDVPIVATIHAFKHGFSDALKRRDDVELLRLTRANRDALVDEIASRFLGPGVAGVPR